LNISWGENAVIGIFIILPRRGGKEKKKTCLFISLLALQISPFEMNKLEAPSSSKCVCGLWKHRFLVWGTEEKVEE
jgi:hypothetical protein